MNKTGVKGNKELEMKLEVEKRIGHKNNLEVAENKL